MKFLKQFAHISFNTRFFYFFTHSSIVTFPLSPLSLNFNYVISKNYLKLLYSKVSQIFSSQFGYFAILHVKGIGFKVYHYKAINSLYFILGYNHVTKFSLPEGCLARVRKQYVLLYCSDKRTLASVSYLLQHLRFPDPYRGKGIRYRYQIMNFKPGKQR